MKFFQAMSHRALVATVVGTTLFHGSLTPTSAFVTPFRPHTTTSPIRVTTSRPATRMDLDNRDDVNRQLSFIQDLFYPPSWKSGSFSDSLDYFTQNTYSSGGVGDRGEGFVIVQTILSICILLGVVPLIGNTLFFVLGPGLLTVGVIISLLSILELRESASPWTVPSPASQDLKTEGLYEWVRHPLYTGLLAIATGYSLWTDSATRLFLVAALWYAFELKTDHEESSLMDKFPGEYTAYQQRVPGKFFPKRNQFDMKMEAETDHHRESGSHDDHKHGKDYDHNKHNYKSGKKK